MREQIKQMIARFEENKARAQQGIEKAESQKEAELYLTIIEISDLSIADLKKLMSE